MAKRVLSIGQCVPDNMALERFLKANFVVDFVTADKLDDGQPELDKAPVDLVLVNRKLDCDYTDGLLIVQALKAAAATKSIPVMLVTNYEDAQAAAAEAGALPGFGKLEYGKPETKAKLAAVLA